MASISKDGRDENDDKNYEPLDIDDELGLSSEDNEEDGLEDVEEDDVSDEDGEDASKTEDEESLEVLKKREEDGEDFR